LQPYELMLTHLRLIFKLSSREQIENAFDTRGVVDVIVQLKQGKKYTATPRTEISEVSNLDKIYRFVMMVY
jgi:hypothetical protein